MLINFIRTTSRKSLSLLAFEYFLLLGHKRVVVATDGKDIDMSVVKRIDEPVLLAKSS